MKLNPFMSRGCVFLLSDGTFELLPVHVFARPGLGTAIRVGDTLLSFDVAGQFVGSEIREPAPGPLLDQWREVGPALVDASRRHLGHAPETYYFSDGRPAFHAAEMASRRDIRLGVGTTAKSGELRACMSSGTLFVTASGVDLVPLHLFRLPIGPVLRLGEGALFFLPDGSFDGEEYYRVGEDALAEERLRYVDELFDESLENQGKAPETYFFGPDTAGRAAEEASRHALAAAPVVPRERKRMVH